MQTQAVSPPMSKINTILLLAAALAGACKSAPSKDSPEAKADRSKIDCSVTPPVRTDYREDGTTVESIGPVDTEGVPCDKADKLKAKKTGAWINYYPTLARVQSKGNFAAGRRTGLWESYSETGNLTKSQEYKEHKLDGAETLYFDTPEKTWKSQGAYAMGLKTGKWSERSSPQATCVTEGSYTADLKTGAWRECRTNAQTKETSLAFEGAYQGGLKNGKAKFYHPGGSLQSEGNFRADKECFEKLKDDEKRDTQKRDACARPTGKWTFYHASGGKLSQGEFDTNGKRQGAWSEFYANGKIAAQGNYKDNKKTRWAFFSKDGSKYADVEYGPSGALLKAMKLYEENRAVAEGDVAMGAVRFDAEKDDLEIKAPVKKGVWIEYHANGKKSGEGEYSMNKRQGAWKHYDEQGGLISEGSYTMDKKQGAWREKDGGGFVTKKYMMGNPAP